MRFDEFFAHPMRSGSPERSLGPGWTSDDEVGIVYTLYWIEKTGEVYGVRHQPVAFGPGAPKPYGVYLPTVSTADERHEVRLLGTVDLEAFLEIETEAESLPRAQRSLAWLDDRVHSS